MGGVGSGDPPVSGPVVVDSPALENASAGRGGDLSALELCHSKDMQTDPAIGSLKIRNLLSFGEEATAFDLLPLNVLIGPNGSGKSNLIEVLGLLQNAPKELATAIGNGGPIDEWLWKGASKSPTASIEAIISPPSGTMHELGHLKCNRKYIGWVI